MISLLILLVLTLGLGALGYGLEALFGDHDPGAVFPWGFMALLTAVGCAVIGFVIASVIDIANLLFRWW